MGGGEGAGEEVEEVDGACFEDVRAEVGDVEVEGWEEGGC